MIQSHDRSGWFGASDTAMIMGNWNTKTFQNWWMQKLGLNTDHFSTAAMNAGTYYEHEILKAIGARRMDHQILIPELRLRVNLDGDGPGMIHECKTYKEGKPFKVSKAYHLQVQAQIFAKIHEEGTIPQAEIIAYPLTDAEYKNFFLDIDPEKISHHPIEFDPFFAEPYVHRLKILCKALEAGVFPRLEREK